MSGRRRRHSGGQAMIEFSLVAMVLLMIFLGIMDFAFLYAGKISTVNSARAAARFAATHSTAWDGGANPASTSIQGQLKTVAIPAVIINDDAHVTIEYSLPGLGGGTKCGQWSQSGNAFQPAAGYTQSTCVVSGNVVSITATYLYKFITPMLSNTYTSPTILSQARELIEN